MKLEIRTQGVELTDTLELHIRRRLSFALSRFSDRLRRVRVSIADTNGPKGGNDIHCKVKAELNDHGDLIIREVNHDPFAAVARAVERASQSLGRRVARLRGRRRFARRRFTRARIVEG